MKPRKSKSEIRTFASGANRDTSQGKLEYYGFMHPLVDYSFAKYMDSHRHLPNGELRDSNNWWKGFPAGVAMQSLCRHVEDVKLIEAGYHVFEVRKGDECYRAVAEIEEVDFDNAKAITLEEALNGVRFNSQAMLREYLES